ncbi:hypothetical protein GJ496_001263 [Pomphorhynchus laevis]|nr:hypothetical protein GJ496_001263 [Pomphorhynchus laevis]
MCKVQCIGKTKRALGDRLTKMKADIKTKCFTSDTDLQHSLTSNVRYDPFKYNGDTIDDCTNDKERKTFSVWRDIRNEILDYQKYMTEQND